MNRQIAQLLMLKDTWILINKNTMVYIHEATFKRKGDVIIFNWNNNTSLIKSCRVDEINNADFLDNVQLFSRLGILRYFNRLAEYAATIEGDGDPVIYFRYLQYNNNDQERATANTKQLLMAKSYTRDILILNDNANWRVLDIEKGLFQLPLHENSPASKAATAHYDWSEPEGQSEYPMTNEKCVSVHLPPGFVTRMSEIPTVEFFQPITDFFSKDSGLEGL